MMKMIYVYDILLNFNENMIHYFEWEDQDDIKYIKKIPLIKVSDELLINLVNKKAILNNKLLEKIEKKTIFYDGIVNNDEKYIFLGTNGEKVMAFLLKNNRVFKTSELLLEEEEEVLEISENLDVSNIGYEIDLNIQDKEQELTRNEQRIKEVLIQELKHLKYEKNYEKLNYYYFEYFGKLPINEDETYQELINSIDNLTEKHKDLFNILMLSYQNK